MKKYDKLYINGEWVAPHGQGESQVINPFNDDVAGVVPQGDQQDVDNAVSAAKAAFSSWSATSPEERADWIKKLADALGARMKEVASTISQEMGMPISMAELIQAGLPYTVMSSYVDIARNYKFTEEMGNSLVTKEPIGVCGFITPWNYPLHQVVGKVAPALAAGCTMVLKPSKEAPLNAFLFAEIVDEVGLPAGVFNLVSGPGSVIGEALAGHPDVD